MDAQPIVKQAMQAFTAGQFDTALDLYKKAANTYGKALFEVNIALCQRRLKNSPASNTEATQGQGTTVEQQLRNTQQLLEYYFTLSQELEAQLLGK